MALISPQQLNQLYEQFREIEVTFTRQVVETLGLLQQQVTVKCLGDQVPCTIYAASMAEARVILSLEAEFLKKIRQANFAAALRFSFRTPRRSEPLTFFVPAKVTGRQEFSPELHFLHLSYTGRPADDLIERLGQLLEANVNAARRSEVRIDITPASLKELRLESREAVVLIEGKPRTCILRDLSVSGAKLLVFGAAEEFIQRSVVVQPRFGSHPGGLSLPGRVLRYEEVVGREDIGAIGVRFEVESVPMPYKVIINDFLRRHPGLGDPRPG